MTFRGRHADFYCPGACGLVINTFLLWVTDKVVDDEICSLGMTFIMAVLLTVGRIVLRAVL